MPGLEPMGGTVVNSSGYLVLNYSCPFAYSTWDYTRPEDGLEDWQRTQIENRRRFLSFINLLASTKWYDPLPILMRAINGLRLRWQSRAAPRWRRGRWRALA